MLDSVLSIDIKVVQKISFFLAWNLQDIAIFYATV